jgi:hypothetical protein
MRRLQEEDEERTMKDKRGIPIEPGVMVAYNMCGQVAVGSVVEVTKSGKIRICLNCTVDLSGVKRRLGHISEVKQADNVMVISGVPSKK